MDLSNVRFYVINLLSAEKRRDLMLRQAEAAGLPIEIIPAISGRDLTPEDRAAYNWEKRALYMTVGLSDNEIACVLSHHKTLKAFLDSGAPYGVILEDDVEVMPQFPAVIDELVHHLCGWQVAKLYTADGKLYPLSGCHRHREAAVRAVFPKKIMWRSAAYMYTRDGAQILYKKLLPFWRATDTQIAEILLREKVPTIGVAPSPVDISEEDAYSCIDADDWGRYGSRRVFFSKGRRSFAQYCRYRLYILTLSFLKMRMIRTMRRLLRRQ